MDISLDTFNACVEGYSDRLFDQKCLSVQQGFWAGYYSNAKHPKKLSFILDKMQQTHEREKKRALHKPNSAKPDVDVDAYLEQERIFKERLAEG